MNVKTQIISLLYSGLMGVVLYLLSYLNYKIVYKNNVIWKYILTFIFVIDYSLLYIIGLYYINDGVVHIYFIMLVILFFYASVKLMPSTLKIDNFFNE